MLLSWGAFASRSKLTLLIKAVRFNQNCLSYTYKTRPNGEFPAEGFYLGRLLKFHPFFPLLSGPEVILGSGKCFALGVLQFTFSPSSVECLGERLRNKEGISLNSIQDPFEGSGLN